MAKFVSLTPGPLYHPPCPPDVLPSSHILYDILQLDGIWLHAIFELVTLLCFGYSVMFQLGQDPR